MINSNKYCTKNILGFAWKETKTQVLSGGIRNVEIRVVHILHQLFFPKFFKLWHQKICFATGHQDIGKKL